jgi:hypothetical protein
MTTYEIPLSADPQKLAVTLGTTEYHLRVYWCDAGQQSWLLDISDSSDNPLACGLPLVTGADILGQFKYLGIPGSLAVATDGDPDAIPTFSNLGTTSHLYFITQ